MSVQSFTNFRVSLNIGKLYHKMISKILNKIFPSRRKPIKRTFNPSIFSSKQQQASIEKNGYIHLKDIVTNEEISSLLDIYNNANDTFHFNTENKNFLNTMALKDGQAKKYIQKSTLPIINRITSRFLNKQLIWIPFGGAFCVNPPNAIQSCKPHQDPAYVNENHSYSIIVWIPLTDINTDNGCLHVLPGSHLWGNSHRSISMDWAFENYSEKIWEFLIPIPVKRGDIICFDAALIHGTNVNSTGNNRLAVNIPVLPRNEQMITYYPIDKKTGYLYEIDEDYYLNEYLFSEPSGKYINKGKMQLKNNYSLDDVKRLYNYQLKDRTK